MKHILLFILFAARAIANIPEPAGRWVEIHTESGRIELWHWRTQANGSRRVTVRAADGSYLRTWILTVPDIAR